ncbi:hypothetical protein [Pontimicrobium sp. IMCC45349]|uniref:hypothetical protein n=1 Tax=Pontimicrobium sp. IMCC45349 TaxID=3391574 RepID=UPI0039A3DCD0
MIIIAAIVVILLTIAIVWLIDKFVPKKFKPVILIVLWVIIGYLGYITFMSVYGEIQFNKLKDKRYKVVIENLKDIRDSQLAHRSVTGQFQGNWDNLVKFIDTAEFTLTQRRDSSILDQEMTRRYGVDTYKDIVIIDTLGTVGVKDSLFGADSRYKTMMNIPVGKAGEKFELKAGLLDQNGINIPVFEVLAKKSVILDGQDKNLIAKENQVVSVDGVNGDALKVGSMEEVNTNGNWPKNYSKEQ